MPLSKVSSFVVLFADEEPKVVLHDLDEAVFALEKYAEQDWVDIKSKIITKGKKFAECKAVYTLSDKYKTPRPLKVYKVEPELLG